MKINLIAVLGALVVTVGPVVKAQSPTHGKTPDYRLGQVWATDQGIMVTVLAVDDLKKVGRVVHVRVDKIPWQSCGGVHLTRTIEHVAIPEKMMQKSGLVLSKENADLPQSSIEAYREWQGQKKREVAKAPVLEIIRAQGYVPGPMICNILPSQT